MFLCLGFDHRKRWQDDITAILEKFPSPTIAPSLTHMPWEEVPLVAYSVSTETPLANFQPGEPSLLTGATKPSNCCTSGPLLFTSPCSSTTRKSFGSSCGPGGAVVLPCTYDGTSSLVSGRDSSSFFCRARLARLFLRMMPEMMRQKMSETPTMTMTTSRIIPPVLACS